MLHPKTDRIDYGAQLIPPEGYELAEAIGTTYSLDLDTLMVLPVALFYSQLVDETYDNLRFDMLESITKASEKITVYYHNGQLKVPHKYHYLMAYWEEGIVPVTMPHYASSFHPKVWLMRYCARNRPAKYRLLITSRNMTNCRDWDIAFSTNGTLGEKEEVKNKPLLDFLLYLNSHNKKISEQLLTEILLVKFDLPELFDRIKFHPIIPELSEGIAYFNVLTAGKTSYDELLIISPFLDNLTLKKLADKTTKTPWLLSRQSELDYIDEEILNCFNCWKFSSRIENGEYDESIEENVLPMEQNLHAKLFIAQSGDSSDWLLGSANCTDPAQGRNVEFMVQLKDFSGRYTPKQIFRLLTSEKEGELPIFVPYVRDNNLPSNDQRRIDLEVRRIKFELSNLAINGAATLVSGGTAYDLSIVVDLSNVKISAEYSVFIRPLPEKSRAHKMLLLNSLNVVDSFKGYPETLLSPFIEFEIRRGDLCCSSFLLTMTIDLPSTRFNKIFTSLIDSREKFLKYLTFLLTGEDAELVDGQKSSSSKLSLKDGRSTPFPGVPVYEKMLLAASRYPSRLKAIDKLVERLKAEAADHADPIVSIEFDSFWDVFRRFVESKKGYDGKD